MQLPRFDYSIRIHPKPRGNWRPKVEISLQIKAEDHPWRPKLKGLCIWGVWGSDWNLYGFNGVEPCIYLDQIQGRAFVPDISGKKPFIWLGDLQTGEPTAIWDKPQRGESNACNYSKQEHSSYTIVLDDGYLEKDKFVTRTFYLPWRPGARPDYSDFMQRLALIPQIVYNQLLDGIDSGESTELNLSGTATAGMFATTKPAVGEKKKVTRRVIRRKGGDK